MEYAEQTERGGNTHSFRNCREISDVPETKVVQRIMKLLIMAVVFWQTLNASAYTWTGNPTASGVYPVVGHCAVDKINGQWIPFGSRITLPDGRILVVTDRFGASHENRLDVYLPTENECWNFGRQMLKCRIEVEK